MPRRDPVGRGPEDRQNARSWEFARSPNSGAGDGVMGRRIWEEQDLTARNCFAVVRD